MTESAPSGAGGTDGFDYAALDVLELRGADALAFAQAQLASDTSSLPDGHWQWTSYLTPPGRTIAVMLLLRQAGDAIDLLVPAQRGGDLASRLQRFVFRSKVKLAVSSERRCKLAFGHSTAAQTATSGPIDSTDSALHLVLAPGLRIEVSTGAAAAADPVVESAWRHFLIHAGVPLLAGAAIEAFTPHALGLDALDAISTRKGCYPGQEIVARTHFLGRNKRKLFRYFAPARAALAPATTLHGPAGSDANGTVVLSNPVQDGTEGLLVAHEQVLETGPLLLGDAPVRLMAPR